VAGIFLPGSSRGGTGDITGVTAGTGLSGGGDSGALTLALDLNELSAVTPADGDSLATIDSDGANEQLTTVAALATLFSGDGLAASSSVMGVDLVSNGGLEISSNKLQVATGISQYDVAQFAASVADNDFLRIDSTAVEGRSASEVLSDISAAPAAGDSNILTVGALDSGSITSGFGAIDNGTSGIRTNTFTVETSIVPDASGGADIGTNALEWGDVYIADDKKIYLGDGQDVSLEYDEDGTDQLRIAGSTIFQNNIELGEAASVSIGTPLLPTADHTYSGISAEMLAGGAISAFNLVCIHTTTQEVVVADASAIGTARVIGIAPAAISDTATGTVLLQGFIRDDTWAWTTGSPLYLSETAGAMTHTAPTTDGAFVVVVGIALEPDVVYINPSVDIIEHA
jgi:hypothetical protein